ncbi:sigma-70 family RNA polymerase sigma factor [Paractinoplanes maris]|uniref:sigma-70 family RNA polymerase sigma factor n=1 Tax=Paractinoplanes maris TaxID=1734446 RepID=UPI0020207577|nr:sigma-70 family RNA polymerase sigma factor [Actinoplanes maris]
MVIDQSVRAQLFTVAYRILGRSADAEDVVQDVWIRWHRTDPAEVRDPIAFLVTVTRRVALNTATSAHARREVSTGRWAPEFRPAADDPAREAERGESLAAAVQLLVERLTPAECAAYLLHEAFGYPFREIAGVLGVSEASARQLASRARRHLTEPRHRPVDPAMREELLTAFLEAARAGAMARLVELLARDRTDSASGGRSGQAGRWVVGRSVR